MSTLVVVRKGRTAVIASDSFFGQGSIRVSPTNKINHQKIFQIGNAYVGFTGWSAMINIFEHVISQHPKIFDFGSRKLIFQTFLTLHQILKDEYFIDTKEKDNQPVESSQWDCLIASPSGIYQVQSYREVAEFQRYWADGSGTEYALGALHATYDLYDDPQRIAAAAIAAGSEFDEGSGLPVQTFSLELNA